tara:strand:- start:88 stop:738 length:651 start_codon:yes stop_codon:yes gene_type:complete
VIIAIDGPAGSGKSTTSKLVAERLGISHLDTGSMYRAVTLYFIENQYHVDEINIDEVLESINIEISNELVFLNGRDVTSKLRDPKVSSLVSDISSLQKIRFKMVQLQRNISKNKSIVIDGRDIGTVVFPEADFKFFITASIEVRASRRFDELKASNSDITLDEILGQIEKRDYFDSTRDNSPLKKASDAITIDTTRLSIDEQVNLILETINNNARR